MAQIAGPRSRNRMAPFFTKKRCASHAFTKHRGRSLARMLSATAAREPSEAVPCRIIPRALIVWINSWDRNKRFYRSRIPQFRTALTNAGKFRDGRPTGVSCNSINVAQSEYDLIQAINGATGDLVWEYQRQLPEDVTKIFPVPSINRNIAIYGNHIIDTSADDFVYALNAQTGKLDWENRIVDYRENSAQERSGPLIAAGKIVSGRGCEPKGGPDACIITAHDAETGKEVWRVHTIPKPGEPGNESWGDIPYEQRKHVGAWMVPSYDPELHLIYIRTSVTSPAPKFMLAGNDKKYLLSQLHTGSRCRHRQDGVVLPAHRRSLGS